ncbi:universal stress protein [Jannaschia aquimarina]|nr:universal stress protein [Jannaschia aquimarina]
MFKRIMTPVDLGHVGKLEKALAAAAALAKSEGAAITYVSVTSPQPGAVAHSPEEFKAKLEAFASEQGSAHGIPTDAHVIVSHDPSVDVDDALLKAVTDLDADLVVMASHAPGFADYFWPSNGGKVAAHSKASVFVVRDN